MLFLLPCRDFRFNPGIANATELFSKSMFAINGEHPFEDEGIVRSTWKLVGLMMGLNAFVAFSLVLGAGLSWQTALGAVFVSGLIFIAISLPGINLREKIIKAVPKPLRLGVASGIGLFLAFIGLQNAGIVVKSSATLVTFGGLSVNFVIFLIGLVLTAFLLVKKIRGALLLGIIGTSVIAVIASLVGLGSPVSFPESVFALPSLSAFLEMNILGVFSFGMIAPVFSLIFTDMFDSISTFLGVSEAGGMKDSKGNPKNAGRALFVDATATTLSGIFGSSPATTYIESASGVEEGGRTGLTAVIVGLLFLPFMFLSPLLSFIPMVAVSPVIVLVGLFMMRSAMLVDWHDYTASVPAFAAMIAIPMTYSITQGIVFGFLTYILIQVLVGKLKNVSPTLWVIGGLSVLSLITTIL